MYMLDIIKVPLDHPEQAEVIPGARIFTGLEPTPECRTLCAPEGTRRQRPRAPGDSTTPLAPPARTGPRNCHDVTAYPALNLLAAACQTHSILVDISNPEKPVRKSFSHRHQQLPGPSYRCVQQRRQQDHHDRRVGRRHVADVSGPTHERARRKHHHLAQPGWHAEAARVLQASRRAIRGGELRRA
jgi:hypothetical protein